MVIYLRQRVRSKLRNLSGQGSRLPTHQLLGALGMISIHHYAGPDLPEDHGIVRLLSTGAGTQQNNQLYGRCLILAGNSYAQVKAAPARATKTS